MKTKDKTVSEKQIKPNTRVIKFKKVILKADGSFEELEEEEEETKLS